MQIEQIIHIDNYEIVVNFSFIPGEPCRPKSFDPGCEDEYELNFAKFSDNDFLYLDITNDHTKSLIIEALQVIRQTQKVA